MTNENREEFLKNQRDLKYKYLGGAENHRSEAISDSAYNNRSDTDISPGADGRSIMKKDE
jgi:hypothetical protein